jgi:uncharacterized protein (TIGR04255 family)
MTERERFRPFTGDTDRRITLTRAPLALVLVQVRWPEHGRLLRDFKSIALTFGETLDDFPLYRELHEQGIQITPEGVQTIQGERSFQWRSLDNIWTVHLTQTSMSLFCLPHVNYRFSEVTERLRVLLNLLSSILEIRLIDRIGVRYVNRLTNVETHAALPEIFDGAILGMSQLSVRPTARLVSTLSQAVYSVEGATLQVRSGYLAPGETMDQAIAPVDNVSWVLDMDAFDNVQRMFDIENVEQVVGRLADTVYDFFKLVMQQDAETRLEGQE